MTEAQNLLGLETQRKRDVWACIYVEGANIYVVFVGIYIYIYGIYICIYTRICGVCRMGEYICGMCVGRYICRRGLVYMWWGVGVYVECVFVSIYVKGGWYL